MIYVIIIRDRGLVVTMLASTLIDSSSASGQGFPSKPICVLQTSPFNVTKLFGTKISLLEMKIQKKVFSEICSKIHSVAIFKLKYTQELIITF